MSNDRPLKSSSALSDVGPERHIGEHAAPDPITTSESHTQRHPVALVLLAVLAHGVFTLAGVWDTLAVARIPT